MNLSHAWFKFIIIFITLRDNDDFTLGLPNWQQERVKKLAAIYQIKDLSKFSLVNT